MANLTQVDGWNTIDANLTQVGGWNAIDARFLANLVHCFGVYDFYNVFDACSLDVFHGLGDMLLSLEGDAHSMLSNKCLAFRV